MKVAWTTHSRDIFLQNFPKWRPAAILDLIEPEIAQFDPPTPKTLPRTKHEVHRMTGCVAEIYPFKIVQEVSLIN